MPDAAPSTPPRRPAALPPILSPHALNPFLSPPDWSPDSSGTHTSASDAIETDEPRVRTATIERVSTELGRVLNLDQLATPGVKANTDAATSRPVQAPEADPALPVAMAPTSDARTRAAMVKHRRPQPLQSIPDDAVEQLDQVEMHRLSAFLPSPLKAASSASPPSADSHAPVHDASSPPLNASFLRWSQLTESMDAMSAVSPPSAWSFHGDAEDAKRSSTGTFGGDRPRRWSAAPSSSVGSAACDDDPFSDGAAGHAADDADAASPPRKPRKPRPVSLSSASTGSAPGAPDLRPRLAALRAQSSPPSTFPSPTMKRQAHKQPETEQAINTHLLKSSSTSDVRIVPRMRALPLGLSPATAPPSSGTPLRAGGVREEANSSESDFAADTPARAAPKSAAHSRKNSKLDQVLGDGAETARVLLEFERRAVDKALASPVPTLPPPARGHKPSASQPPGMTPSMHAETLVSSLQRARSSSLDSLPSLHPSIAESTHTLARLIPSSASTATLPPVPSISPLTLPRMPAAISSKNDLTPDQKARLVRRTRKLEQVLGETLKETQIERLVIEPSTTTQTVVTRLEHDDGAWPATPPAAEAEWDRADVVPRRSREHEAAASTPVSRVERSGSKVARKAKAALGVGRKADPTTDVKVYVVREMSVSETSVAMRPLPAPPMSPAESVDGEWRGEDGADGEDEGARRTRRMQLTKLHRLLGVPIPAALVNPSSQEDLAAGGTSLAPVATTSSGSTRPDTPESSFISFDDSRARETTPAKWASKIRQSLKARSSSSPRAPAGLGIGGVALPATSSGADSFMEFGDETQRTDKERQAARRRAHKLEQVFGDIPPAHSAYVPTHSPAPSYDAYRDSLQGLIYMVEHDRARLTSIVDSLAEPRSAAAAHGSPTHARAPRSARAGALAHAPTPSFGSALDAPMSAHSSAGTPSPPSPRLQSPLSAPGFGYADDGYAAADAYAAKDLPSPPLASPGLAYPEPDPHSHAARRRRTGKLSHFFGEAGVDFSALPLAPPPGEVPGAGSTRRRTAGGGGGGGGSGRRETLDAVLGEMWRGVLLEVRGGTVGRDEAASLGDLIRTLVRKRDDAAMWEEL